MSVEAIVHTKGPRLHGREAAADVRGRHRPADSTSSERQVERYRDKRTTEVRRRAQHSEPPVAPEDPIVLPRDESAA